MYLYFVGTAVSCKWVPAAGGTQVPERKHDLFFNSPRWVLSPTEAHLSAQIKRSARLPENAADYR